MGQNEGWCKDGIVQQNKAYYTQGSNPVGSGAIFFKKLDVERQTNDAKKKFINPDLFIFFNRFCIII